MRHLITLAWIPLLLAGAWRRDGRVPDAGVGRPPVPHLAEDGPAPDKESATGTVAWSPRSPDEASGSERRPHQQAATLEQQLRETEEKLDATRAKLARLLHRRGPSEETLELFLIQALADSRARENLLEAQLEVLETAYVERVAPLRRSD